MSGSSAGAGGFDMWDHFLDRAGVEDGEGVVEMEAEPMSADVRGHLFISLLPLSSPTLHLFICIPPPHLCTIFKNHT
jgi:hypothetical protein